MNDKELRPREYGRAITMKDIIVECSRREKTCKMVEPALIASLKSALRFVGPVSGIVASRLRDGCLTMEVNSEITWLWRGSKFVPSIIWQ